MHKNFAKTPFLGKSLISLPECHSTNDFMAQLAANQQLQHGDIIMTNFQSRGKGQRGNNWISEPGKNLLFSMYINPKFLEVNEAYLLNLITGISITQLVEKTANNLTAELKWPNDVYVRDRKIAGILIETSLRKQFEYAIVGVGLNVNQSYFALPTATSLNLEAGSSFDLLTLLENFTNIFRDFYQLLEDGKRDLILKKYHEKLYWRGEPHIYKSSDGEFEAILIGIDKNGNLVLNIEGRLKHFRIKEVEFIR